MEDEAPVTCVATEKSGKMVMPLPLKETLPLSRATLRIASLSRKWSSFIIMARGGDPGGRGRMGILCALSMANIGEKVLAQNSFNSNLSMNVSGVLPSAPSGNPKKRRLFLLKRSSISVILSVVHS